MTRRSRRGHCRVRPGDFYGWPWSYWGEADPRVEPARPDLVAKAVKHGSWNRGHPVGYKVVYVPFRDGMPTGKPQDFLTGFRPDPEDTETYGRPVDVLVDKAGGLLVTDDAADIVWRVTATGR